VTSGNLFSAGSNPLGLGFATPKHGYATHNLVAVLSRIPQPFSARELTAIIARFVSFKPANPRNRRIAIIKFNNNDNDNNNNNNNNVNNAYAAVNWCHIFLDRDM
jgi:hypothetical protein